MDCELKRIGKGEEGRTKYKCKWCKRQYQSAMTPDRIHRMCPARPETPPIPAPLEGPGTELKKLLAAWGITASSCNCELHAAEMNQRGADWCAANIPTIVGWLREEAKKRWLGFLFVESQVITLIEQAIENARRQDGL